MQEMPLEVSTLGLTVEGVARDEAADRAVAVVADSAVRAMAAGRAVTDMAIVEIGADRL